MKTKKEMFDNKPNTDSASNENAGIRINKYLAESGTCSRREADKLVADGKVRIDGEIAVMGSKVLPGQRVTVQGQDIKKNEDLILIAFNKPVGVVSTTDKRDPDNIIDYINYIQYHTMSSWISKILRAGNYHEKEYIVTVNKDITPDFLRIMGSGVPILETVTRPCQIEQIDKKVFKIILTQGLNRQIRRMCEALGYRVRALTRVRIMNIRLGHLKTGTWRNLTPKELEELKEMLVDSSSEPIKY